MGELFNRQLVLGVTGGIAAYKSADLIRRLRAEGVQVRVVMTPRAKAFITPLTLQAVSGHPVHQALLDPETEAGMGHIELARWAERVLVAPATADFMARLAHGLADDLLTTLCLATRAPVMVAPAMNQQMWRHPATQANRRVLVERGVALLGPAEGGQACGESGPGRLLEPAELVEQVAQSFAKRTGKLRGCTVMVTAGPTQEAIDPVRYLSNRSSGKMGFAVAHAAWEAGAKVVLISGPVGLATPRDVERIDCTSADQMYEAVMKRVGEVNIFISAAAVADYRPTRVASHKLKKSVARMSLELERTPDILAAVATLPIRPFTVGFAAETEDLYAQARKKLAAKSLDMIAANWVGEAGRGFGVDDNALTILWPGGGCRELALAPKFELARQLIDLVAERYYVDDSKTSRVK
jgi:phosphopantothenoylcysteine decarboxylase/phosphopantothenate--cysteine ligase